MTRQVCAIARNTLRECVRSRAIYGMIGLAVMLVALSTLLGSVTIGDQMNVVKDFGLFAITLSGAAYTLISGSMLLEKELTRRTIVNVLSKAVSRTEFIVGKFLGMLGASTVLLVGLAIALLTFLWALSGRFEPLLLQAFFGIFCELTIICALTIFFSALVTTPILAGCCTVAVVMTGRSAEYLLYCARGQEASPPWALLLESLYQLVPHLHALVLSDQVVHGIAVSEQHLLWGGIYALSYSSALVILACIVFSRRDFSE